MKYEEVIRLNSRVTLQQMLQREEFQRTARSPAADHAHEIQYPIMQGWDSVMVKADVELAGPINFQYPGRPRFSAGAKHAAAGRFSSPILEGLEAERK